MKHIAFLLSILVLLALAACTLPVPTEEAPTAVFSVTETPVSEVEVPTEVLPVTEVAAPPTEVAPPPTETAIPTSPTPQAAVDQPTATKEAAEATPTKAPTYNPNTALGEPSYHNPMEVPNYSEWAKAGTTTLPDDQNVRLQFKDGELYVTGKQLDFSTWWFSSHTLTDAYIEMTFNSENCSGKDAYGMISVARRTRPANPMDTSFRSLMRWRIMVFRLDGH
jgi:hypothetical protein